MRWKAETFWVERGDVLPTQYMTTHDLLWWAFSAGAREAEALPAHPSVGHGTVRVRGLGWRGRRRLRATLAEKAPVGTELHVEVLR